MCASQEEQTKTYSEGWPSEFAMPDPQAQGLTDKDRRSKAMKVPAAPSTSCLCPYVTDSTALPATFNYY